MYIILQLILLGDSLAMFVVKREIKLALLLLPLICFTFVSIPWIPWGGPLYPPLCFLLSEFPYWFNHVNKIKKSLYGFLLGLIIIALIISFFNSPHYQDPAGIIKLTIKELVSKYFFLAYGFLCINDEKMIKPMLNVSFYALLVLTFFGILNLITKEAILINLAGYVKGDTLMGDFFTDMDRFRVQSMFKYAFDYGYICAVLLIFHYWGYAKKLLKSQFFYISVCCCMFGILTCNCRTVQFCFVFAVMSFIMFRYSLKKNIKYFLVIILVVIIAYINVPYVQEKVDMATSVFDYNSTNVLGSSIQIRVIQYSKVFKYIQGHEFFGRGIDFFYYDLGWGDVYSAKRDPDLWGLEGVFMNLLLERGFVGTIFYIVFYCTIFFYIFKHRKRDRLTSSIAMSLLITYFVYANMMGELYSVPPTLLLVGTLLSLMVNQQQQKAIER
ncbi:MAG: hypothetical protein LUC88_10975 [Prevotella sp.]|nr:hypothetical protein [Prevotella sp.]